MASLDLAVEPRRRERTFGGPQDPRDWYPKTKKDYRWLGEGLKKLVMFAVLVGGAIGGWRWYSAKVRAREDHAISEQILKESILQKALAETPECRLGAAAMWVYVDKRGTTTVVDSLQKVPKQYRKTARCVVPSK